MIKYKTLYLIKLISSVTQSLLLLLFLAVSWQCRQQQNLSPLKTSKLDVLQEKIVLQSAVLKIDCVQKIIETGDLITRTGNDFTSQSLKTLNQRNKTYSHCGIALVKGDSVFIYHALGGEWNPNQKILRQSLLEFTDPVNNNSFGVFRFLLPKEIKQKWVAAAEDFYKKEISFDMAFNLDTNDKMYCAEYVYKCFLAADPALKFNISHIKDFRFIGVDDLFLQEYCRPVTEINYR